MTRTAASIAVVLALLTGLVLGQLGSLATQPAAFRSTTSSTAPGALATARAFYDNLNLLLETGDRAIESSIAPGFIEHVSDGQPDRSLPEMIDWLLATRATWPQMRVTIVSLDQHDSMIVARLEIDPGNPRSIPGVPLPAFEPRLVTEHLRIEGGGITDRWSAVLGLPVSTLALQTELSWNSPALTMPAVVRIALEPGHVMQVPLDGPAILRVESGTVQLSHASHDLDGNEHSAIEPIDAGGGTCAEYRRRIHGAQRLHRTGGSLGFHQQRRHDFSIAGDTRRPSPRTCESTDSFHCCDHPLWQVTLQQISITRVTLPPGATVVPHEAGVMEAVVVLDGELMVTVERGRALLSPEGATAHLFDDSVAIAAGAGISAKGSTSLGYQVAGSRPATLLVMRIDSPVAAADARRKRFVAAVRMTGQQ